MYLYIANIFSTQRSNSKIEVNSNELFIKILCWVFENDQK